MLIALSVLSVTIVLSVLIVLALEVLAQSAEALCASGDPEGCLAWLAEEYMGQLRGAVAGYQPPRLGEPKRHVQMRKGVAWRQHERGYNVMDTAEGEVEEGDGETEKELRVEDDPYYNKPSTYLKL